MGLYPFMLVLKLHLHSRVTQYKYGFKKLEGSVINVMSIKLLLPNGISKLIQYIFSKSNFLSRILLRDQEKLQEDNQESSNLKSRYGNLPL